MKNRLFPIAAVAVMVGLAACGGEEAAVEGEGMEGGTVESTSVTPVVDADTTMAPVVTPVVTADTDAVVTTVEKDVDVDVNREVVENPANAPVVPTP